MEPELVTLTLAKVNISQEERYDCLLYCLRAIGHYSEGGLFPNKKAEMINTALYNILIDNGAELQTKYDFVLMYRWKSLLHYSSKATENYN